MSKQSEAKKAQNYVTGNPKKCSTCGSFQKETETLKGVFGKYYSKDKNLRCGIGGFAVKKTGVCDKWEPVRNDQP